jgi:serine/threonine protein kinase
MFTLVIFLQMARYTTPMYRAPEMVDTWSNHAISTASDVWALGCILYTLCYMKHPFEDSAKLRILNGNYTIPPGDLKYSCFHDLIRKYIWSINRWHNAATYLKYNTGKVRFKISLYRNGVNVRQLCSDIKVLLHIMDFYILKICINPLRPSGNYMNHLLWQSLMLHFVFIGFVWFLP